MSGKIKGLLSTGIMIVILIVVLASTSMGMYTVSHNASECTTNPTMVRTMFEFAGWVPATLLAVGVIMAGVAVVKSRSGRRRRRR